MPAQIDTPSKPGFVSITLTGDERHALRIAAAAADKSVKQFVRDLVTAAIKPKATR